MGPRDGHAGLGGCPTCRLPVKQLCPITAVTPLLCRNATSHGPEGPHANTNVSDTRPRRLLREKSPAPAMCSGSFSTPTAASMGLLPPPTPTPDRCGRTRSAERTTHGGCMHSGLTSSSSRPLR